MFFASGRRLSCRVWPAPIAQMAAERHKTLIAVRWNRRRQKNKTNARGLDRDSRALVYGPAGRPAFRSR